MDDVATGPLDRFPLTPLDQAELYALRARMESGDLADGDPCPPDCPWCRTERFRDDRREG